MRLRYGHTVWIRLFSKRPTSQADGWMVKPTDLAPTNQQTTKPNKTPEVELLMLMLTLRSAAGHTVMNVCM